MFVLVQVSSLHSGAKPKVTGLDGSNVEVPEAELDRFRRKFLKLTPFFDRNAACELAVRVVRAGGLNLGFPSQTHRTRCHGDPISKGILIVNKAYVSGANTAHSHHAEENLLIHCNSSDRNWTVVEIDSILIDIEPCHSERYPPHHCRLLFSAGGYVSVPRNGGAAESVHMRFAPKLGHAYTPILYIQKQPPPGESAQARSTKGGSRTDFDDGKDRMLGALPGETFFNGIKQSTKSRPGG